MVEIARALNPRIEIVIRVHSEEEKVLFEREGLGRVFMGEEALAVSMTAYILDHVSAPNPHTVTRCNTRHSRSPSGVSAFDGGMAQSV